MGKPFQFRLFVKKVTTLQALMIRVSFGVFLSLFLGVLGSAQVHAASQSEVEAMRKSLLESKGKLGELQPFQAQIFENEVLPNAPRFIKNFESKGGGTIVEPDLDRVQRYLEFHTRNTVGASGGEFKPTPLLIVLSMSESCTGCQNSIKEIRRVAQNRFERRGFRTRFLEKESTHAEAETAKNEMFTGEAALLWVHAVEVEDAEHGDKMIKVQTRFDFPKFIHFSAESSVGALEKVDQVAGQMFADVFLKSRVVVLNSSEEGQEKLLGAAKGIWVDIENLNTFSDLERIKKELTEKLSKQIMVPIRVQERVVTRRGAVLWIAPEGDASQGFGEKDLAVTDSNEVLQVVGSGSEATLRWLKRAD